MSATLARLRKRAAELEQKKQFDRALEVYVQILDEGGKDLGDEDVPLFNRVGDMLMRQGSVTEALGYYERAVDMYAERGYLNNAIALCSKILRQSPGRAAVYYKLARISAKKGFKSDARKNFLEYADRMQKLGMADEAFRALKEFATLYPDQDDVRLVLAELLSKENRKGEAIEQLQSLYEKLQSEGRGAEARATVDRMRAIDPSVTPRTGIQSQTPAPAGDLVFLDLSETEQREFTPADPNAPQPPSARAPMPTPVPALTGLSVTFFPEEEAHRLEGFEATSVEPERPPQSTRETDPQFVDLIEEPVAEIAASEPISEPAPWPLEPAAESPASFEMLDDLPRAPESFELAELDQPAAESVTAREAQPELGNLLDDLGDLDDLDDQKARVVEPELDAMAVNGAIEPMSTAEFEAEVAAKSARVRPTTPLSGMEFAGLDLEDAPHAVPARDHDLALPGDLPETPDGLEAVTGPSPASVAASDDARAAAEEAADIVADVAAREAAQHTSASIPATLATLVDEAPSAPDDAAMKALDLIGAKPAGSNESLPDDFLANPPSFGQTSLPEEHAFPPLVGLAESAGSPEDTRPEPEAELQPEEIETALEPVVQQIYVPTPARGSISIGKPEDHLRRRLEIEPENYDLRRQLGEALLDDGDRDGGLHELELAMVGFDLGGDIERAQEVVDEILRVAPASVAHHQKRVEYAVRSRDRGRLANSYLELADALFRTGASNKAAAVYGRVLELDPDSERAELALSTLAPEELVRLRGGPARPDRWSDELTAIAGQPTRQAEVSPASATVSELDPDVASVPATVSRAAQLPTADTPIDGMELPDPDWGEGVPAKLPEPATTVEDHPDDTDREAGQPGHASVETPYEPVVEAPAVLVPPRLPTPRSHTPLAAPRMPTPCESTPATVARITPRPEIPVGSDADFVDLGDWLRETEPTRSTRMQVESPKPTGDEQADFDELLRRFKRGVAENVEAEDYDAHYDLGVAYKEMGLTDEAIAQFQKALRGPNHRVRSYEALGQCFVEKQQYPIAAALLQRATEVPGSDDQHLVGVLYLLGFATEHMGRPADALTYYLRVFAVDIEFRDIAARVAAMGNLTK